jgi:hypothetical protein
MSVAYFIIVNDDVEFSTFVNGVAIAKCAPDLNAFCIKQGLKDLDFFLHFDDSDFAIPSEGGERVDIDGYDADGLNNDEDEADELTQDDEVWFDPQQGLEWVEALIAKLEAEKPDFLLRPHAKEVMSELTEYKEVLVKTRKAGAMWHLTMDY